MDDAQLLKAWENFCDQLKTAGAKAFKPQNPATPLHRADAFRFLTQNLGQAFDLALETKNPAYPALHAFNHPTRKLGGDCADFIYLQAWIDGNSTYRITGNRGTAPFLNFTVQGARPEQTPGGFAPLHDPFGDTPEANLFGHQLHTNWDGSFELIIGGPPQPQNWLPTTPSSRKLFIRQGFDSWDEIPARFRIERVDMTTPKPLPTPEDMITAMSWAGNFITGVMNDWPDWMFAHGGVDEHAPNQFPPKPTQRTTRNAAAPSPTCIGTSRKMKPLSSNFPRMRGSGCSPTWAYSATRWTISTAPSATPPAGQKPISDGKIRIILTHEDPGFHNWIDTQSFIRGNLTYRHMLAGRPAPLSTKLVKHGALGSALPADTARTTPEERAAQMWARFNGIRQRYML